MTEQEFFDRAVIGVIKQGRRSSLGGFCRYRHPAGFKCAVGHCIDDRDYDPAMEFKDVSNIAERLGFPLDLAERVQAAHDDLEDGPLFVADFTDSARTIAADFGLTFPEIPA